MGDKILVFTLIALFGAGSWVAVNGFWAESPVLWTMTPECYDLASLTVIAVQLGNIGPVLYLLFSYPYRSHKEKAARFELVTIYLSYLVGLAACLLLAFLWDKTSYVSGVNHSTALLSLAFFFGIVDCTSSVTFLPFMAQFPINYLNAFYVGQGREITISSWCF